MTSHLSTRQPHHPGLGGNPSETVAALGKLTVSYSGLFAQWLRGLTINAHERLAIAHLWEHGNMTMSELGARIPLSRAAVTALTDRLEALGYVLRTPDEHDRRRTVLSLTMRPSELLEQFATDFHRDTGQLELTFSEAELRTIARWADGLRDIAHSHAARLRARSDDDIPVAEPTISVRA